MARFCLVDDSLFVLTHLEQILRKGGHEVVFRARNGEAALQYLEERASEVDVITLDITMPGMDGMDLLRRARARFPDKICVMVTGLAKRDLFLQARALGAAGYIIKPLSSEAVLEKLAAILPPS